jgi:hypothetical protein
MAMKYVQITEQEYKYLKESLLELDSVLIDMKEMANEISLLREELVYLRSQPK